ncbi:hypothetical protein LZ32DRAFT_384999 [Colletotrichum eremochloae]|nr:hypothetical protein LZ32DRAFT_384999 [Colletotrichum eremochloae]
MPTHLSTRKNKLARRYHLKSIFPQQREQLSIERSTAVVFIFQFYFLICFTWLTGLKEH